MTQWRGIEILSTITVLKISTPMVSLHHKNVGLLVSCTCLYGCALAAHVSGPTDKSFVVKDNSTLICSISNEFDREYYCHQLRPLHAKKYDISAPHTPRDTVTNRLWYSLFTQSR